MSGNPETEVYVEKLPKCDFCDKPAHYDGKTIMGPWAHMCEEHFAKYGVGLGTGKGQKLIPRKALGEAEEIRGVPEKEKRVIMTEEDLEAAALEDVWYPKCPYCGAETPAEPDAHYVYCQACNRRFKILNPFFSKGGAMDREEARRIAEEAAVGAASLVGPQIAKEMAKQQEESLHGSPMTERGKAILGEPPLCYDFRGTRSWVLTRAWQMMEKEKRPSLPVGEAWSDVRRVCAMSPERVEAKKPELCALPHMEQVPACERYVAKVPAGL